MKKILIGVVLIALVFYFWSGKKETKQIENKAKQEAFFKERTQKYSQDYAKTLCELNEIKAHTNLKKISKDVVNLEKGLRLEKQALEQACEGNPTLQKIMQNTIQEELAKCGIKENDVL